MREVRCPCFAYDLNWSYLLTKVRKLIQELIKLQRKINNTNDNKLGRFGLTNWIGPSDLKSDFVILVRFEFRRQNWIMMTLDFGFWIKSWCFWLIIDQFVRNINQKLINKSKYCYLIKNWSVNVEYFYFHKTCTSLRFQVFGSKIWLKVDIDPIRLNNILSFNIIA